MPSQYFRSRRFLDIKLTLVIVALCGSSLLSYAQTETVLYSYPPGGIGNPSFPIGSSFDSAGNLYVTTQEGGANNAGSISQLSPSGGGWNETTIYSFTGADDGALPWTAVVADSEGNLYGGSSNGTTTWGAVYELSPTTVGSWTLTVLHDFAGGVDGAQPVGAMVLDPSGKLFGTAYYGGTTTNGVVFELTRSGSVWTYSVIHNFSGGAGGGAPYGALAIDSRGNLYGTTNVGGSSGLGTVFRLSPVGGGGWRYVVLHSFSGADGASPWAGVTAGPNGTLYGTTTAGGTAGYGVVYRLTPIGGGAYHETVMHSFTNRADGASPDAGVVLDAHGNLFGAAYKGGTGNGVIYEIPHGATGETILWVFNGESGASPFGTPVLDSAGNVYGTTFYGGRFSSGAAFEIVP